MTCADLVTILQEELVRAGVLPQDFDFEAHKQLVPMQPGDNLKVQRLLEVVAGEMSVREMMAALGFASRDKFLKNYLSPALKAGLIEMTDPDSPKSPKQRYRKAQGDM